MLVDIGEVRVFYVETDHILTIEDYGHRHGSTITLTGGRRVESEQSARAIAEKIEKARERGVAARTGGGGGGGYRTGMAG
jgi:hypothetical protein